MIERIHERQPLIEELLRIGTGGEHWLMMGAQALYERRGRFPATAARCLGKLVALGAMREQQGQRERQAEDPRAHGLST